MTINIKDIITSKDTPEQNFCLAIQKAMTTNNDYMLDIFKGMINKKRSKADDLLIIDYIYN